MCFLKAPLESVLQKVLSLESSTQATLTSLDASLSKAISNSNCTILKFLTRLQNPHGVYEARLKKYNQKTDFYTHGESLESWRYEDCLRRHEKKKDHDRGAGRMYDEQVRKQNEGRFEERRREAMDRRVKGWMREMKGTSWNRKARYYRNGID